MSKKKANKKRRSIIKYIICFSFMAYIGYVLVSQQIVINEKKAELNKINEQISIAEAENKTLNEKAKTVNTPEYIEEVARTELDYAAPDEIVFVDATVKD